MSADIKKIPVIVGPTAVGKTALSIELARLLGAEIISADSRQIYKYLDIGTAKVEESLRREIPHHFIDIVEPDAYYSAGMFAKQARKTIHRLQQAGIPVIVVGGSGFYIRALVEGIVEQDVRDPNLRNSLVNKLKAKGLPALYRELQETDPDYAGRISAKDTQRILRALEINALTGKTMEQWHQAGSDPAEFNPLYIGLTMERAALYERINTRVDRMLSAGLLEEVKSLLERGFNSGINALNTVGYKEAFAYLRDEISFQEMAELIKRNSRRYAKRQWTWFKGVKDISWFMMDESTSITELADKICGLL